MQEDSKVGRRARLFGFRWRPVLMTALVHTAVAVLIFLFLDYPLHEALFRSDRDISQSLLGLFRAAGRWPGVILAILLLATLRPKGWPRLVLTVVVACSLMAIFSDVMTRSVCRIRPRNTSGRTVFLPYFDRLTDSGKKGASFSSGDVTNAFTLATVLSAAAPPAAPVLYGLAVGSAWWRISAGAHFASDAYLSAVIAHYGAWVFLSLMGYRRRRRGDR